MPFLEVITCILRTYIIFEEGIRVDLSKVEAVWNYAIPQLVKDIQWFLGLEGWYHRFISHFAEHAASLHALKRKDTVWEWTSKYQQAFT